MNINFPLTFIFQPEETFLFVKKVMMNTPSNIALPHGLLST